MFVSWISIHLLKWDASNGPFGPLAMDQSVLYQEYGGSKLRHARDEIQSESKYQRTCIWNETIPAVCISLIGVLGDK